ncbi:unnamed protein product, partial [Adineta ricciae]
MRSSRQSKSQDSLKASIKKTVRFRTTQDVEQPYSTLENIDTTTTASSEENPVVFRNRQSTSQYREEERMSWRDDSPPRFVPGSTPCRTPFEVFKHIDRVDASEHGENDTKLIKIMLISPTILQSINVETVCCESTFTFKQLVRQQLSLYFKDEPQCKYIVSVLVGNTILADFNQQLGHTAAIENDAIVYILFLPLDEAQFSYIPETVLKPYFNDLTQYDQQTINFFVHYRRPIDEKHESMWEETTEYWERIPVSYRLEKILRAINSKTNRKCYLYLNGNKIALQNKKSKSSQTINDEFKNLEGKDPLMFDIIHDGEVPNIYATIPCTHDSRYDYTAFLQLTRIQLEIILWATNLDHTFAQFLHFCNNDKSGELTTRESRNAILTILRLIRDEDIQPITHDSVFDIKIDWDDLEPTRCAHYLLPIPENAVSIDIYAFRGLLVDALVHYIKITKLKFIRRHNEINLTLPMGTIWNQSVEPFLEKVKLVVHEKLMTLNKEKKEMSTHILQFTRTYAKEMLLPPATVYKMAYKHLKKKRSRFLSTLISILISFLITIWIVITIANMVFFYYHSKQLKDNEENRITSTEIYFSLALLIYMVLLDYVARMLQSLANERRKNHSLGNSHRAAVYDLVRYQARPTIVKSCLIERKRTNFSLNLEEDLDEENILTSFSTFFRKLLDRQHRIVGIVIVILVALHVCSPIIAREIVKKKNSEKTSPYP